MKNLAFTLVLLGCDPLIPPDAPARSPGCESACARMAELGCPEAEPTPEGESCEAVCENVAASGLYELDTECVIRARTCGEVSGC